METIADILMVAGALAAGYYCYVLSKRLSDFKSAEDGIGPARASANASSEQLTEMTRRAETAAQRLELLVASMHDIPEASVASEPPEPSEPIFSTRMSRATGT